MVKNNYTTKFFALLAISILSISFITQINESGDAIIDDNTTEQILGEINAPSSAAQYTVGTTIGSKQLIQDTSFDGGTSIWNATDTSGSIDDDVESDLVTGSQGNMKVIGDQGSFSLFEEESGLNDTNWTEEDNPNFPDRPDNVYTNSANGLEVEHTWENEVSDQSPSIHWSRDVSLSQNLSDYEITSASLSSSVHGKVEANGGDSGGIEVAANESRFETQFSTGDYVRFYILLSDPLRNTINEVASYQSTTLGIDTAGDIDTLADTFLTTVNEENLIFFLNTALSYDHKNFVIIMGIRIWCEDNWGVDEDQWNALIFRNVSLALTYEKQIDPISTIEFSQNMIPLNQSEAEFMRLNETTTIDVAIDNAILNFNYTLSDDWPVDSPNARIRVFVRDNWHYQFLDFSGMTSGYGELNSGNGFDVVSLISGHHNESIELKLQLYLPDEILLPENISLVIHDVSLLVNYTVTESGPAQETTIQTLDGDVSYEVTWGNDLTIDFNYTKSGLNSGISSANFDIVWVDNAHTTPTETGTAGTYTFEISTDTTLSGQKYQLRIIPQINETNYAPSVLLLDITIVGRDSIMNLFLNGEVAEETPVIEVPITTNLLIEGEYFDGLSSPILGAEAEIAGSGISGTTGNFIIIGNRYSYIIDTTNLGLGTFYVSFYIRGENYIEGYEKIRISVRPMNGIIKTTNDNATYTIDYGEDFDLDLWVENDDVPGNITNLNVTYSNKDYSGVLTEGDNGEYDHVFENLDPGQYVFVVYIESTDENYKFETYTFTVIVIDPAAIPTWLLILMGSAIAGLSAAFIAYQRVYKYPKIIRNIRKMKKAIKHGKFLNVPAKSGKDLFAAKYMEMIGKDLPGKTQGQIKSKIVKSGVAAGVGAAALTKADVAKKGTKIEPVKKVDAKEVSKKDVAVKKVDAKEVSKKDVAVKKVDAKEVSKKKVTQVKDVEDLQKKETKSVWNTIDFKEVPKVKELDSKKKSKPAPKKK